MRPQPDPGVAAWLAAQPRPTLWTTVVVEAELLAGIELLPPGRRRDLLGAQARGIFEEDLAGRVLPFLRDAVPEYARIVALRERAGRPIGIADAMIAAAAIAAGAATVATRNTDDFALIGLAILDPWSFAP